MNFKISDLHRVSARKISLALKRYDTSPQSNREFPELFIQKLCRSCFPGVKTIKNISFHFDLTDGRRQLASLKEFYCLAFLSEGSRHRAPIEPLREDELPRKVLSPWQRKLRKEEQKQREEEKKLQQKMHEALPKKKKQRKQREKELERMNIRAQTVQRLELCIEIRTSIHSSDALSALAVITYYI